MHSTRRNFLGALGATAIAGAASRGAKAPASPDNKCLFWIAAATPCDKNLKFDDGIYKDMMSYFKENGADGVVVLGHHRRVSVVLRSRAQEGRRDRAQTPQRPQHHRLARHAQFPRDDRALAARRRQRRGRLAHHSPVLLQEPAAARPDEILFADLRPGENSDQSVSHPRHQRRPHHRRAAA